MWADFVFLLLFAIQNQHQSKNMNTRHVSMLSFLAVLLLAFNTASAQKGSKQNTYSKSTDASGLVWKKQVYRVVDLKKDDAGSDRLRDVNEDKTLIEMLANELKDGALSAYSNSEMRVLNKLSEKEIKIMFGPKPDTAIVQDPETGKWTTNITKKDFNYDQTHKYKILEEWSCHPATGTTDIQILAICPIKDIVAHDGSVRGQQPLLWMRFSDVSRIFDNYQQYQPNNTIPSHIWDDYFSSDIKPTSK
jgi:hypothetical protein